MDSQTLVVKIGTSSLTHPQSGDLSLSTLASLVETLTRLRRRGYRPVLVSSGAVGVGCARLGLSDRPRRLATKQAVAAVGQGRLMRVYDDLFTSLQQPIAQILLTRQDFVRRNSYVNAYNTFQELLRLGIVPIVNENDTIATDELKFGDNDTLSALVASLVEADWLFLLTDVDRLYSADPNRDPNAKPISRVGHLNDLDNLEVGNSRSGWGTGGMQTKISAARIATESGVRTVIASGNVPANIEKILAGEELGTHFEPQVKTETARKRWIAHSLIPHGKIYLDSGATIAVCEGGKSLLAAGVVKIDGDFQADDAVTLCDLSDREIGRGVINYNSRDLAKICGVRSEQIPEILGDRARDTVVHRDNLVLLDRGQV
ncbi:glutamate 5-kinase [Baaleninema simplex]|uniref:glutamate 5-kinase n=1 Tax=Baaleninema simplex TaxID=2862350 RepID=UPI00034A6247|nr:glutamate 5-kinase [Baaleninema simplex]